MASWDLRRTDTVQERCCLLKAAWEHGCMSAPQGLHTSVRETPIFRAKCPSVKSSQDYIHLLPEPKRSWH